MKVAVTSTGPSMDATIDPRFGRCGCFVFVETDDMSFKAVDNAGSERGGGAGIEAGRLMAQNGVSAVLTGSCGPNAHQTLTAAGIEVFIGCSGTVSEAVMRFKSGQLRAASSPDVARHAGMGGGQ